MADESNSGFDVVALVRVAADNVVAAVTLPAEISKFVREAQRVLAKIERTVDRAEDQLTSINPSVERMRRVEQAILNIERATSGVEAAMNALPRVLRDRIWGGGKS